MPSYSFRNKLTGEEFEDRMTIAECEAYLTANPDIEQTILRAPAICDPVRLGRIKPDAKFQDRLKHIKKSHRRSTIQTGNITNV